MDSGTTIPYDTPWNQIPLWPYEITTYPYTLTIIYCPRCQATFYLHHGARHEHCSTCGRLITECPECHRNY